MTAARIPTTMDTELLTRAAAGESIRGLAAWLTTEKGITDCSHMAVARRLEALRLESQVPPGTSTQDLDRQLNAQMQVLRNIDDELMELQETGELPDDDPCRQSFERTRSVIFKRVQVAQTLFRYLAARRNAAASRELAEATREAPAAPLNPIREPLVSPSPRVPMVSPRVPGRNEPCFCGSGVKYKKCCAIRPAARSSATVTPTVTA